MDISRLRAAYEARAKAVSELRDLYDHAEGRDLDANEKEKEARLNEDIAEKTALVERGLASVENEARDADFRDRLGIAEGREASETEETRSDRDILLDIANGEIRSHEFEARDLDFYGGNAQGQDALKDETFVARLYEVVRETTPIIQAGATVIRTQRGEKMNLPKVTGFSSAQRIDEGQTLTASDPAFGKATVDVYKYGVFLRSTWEFLTDPYVGIEAFLARQAGVSLADGIGTDLLVGDGTNKPTGVVTATTNTHALATAQTFDFDDLIDTQHSIKSAHRKRASWLMSDSALAVARKVKDGNGRYIWEPSVRVGEPDVILGRPVYTDPSMAWDSGLSTKVALYGDMSAYYVRLAGGVRAETSKDFAFDSDEVVWRFIQRADGVLVDTNATVAIVNPAA